MWPAALSREITMNANEPAQHCGHAPWNKGKVVGQKAPLKLKDVWAIRIHLQMEQRARELALFNLALDSKLRGCDLVGQNGHWALPVSATAMGWSAAVENVALGDCGFQRHRTRSSSRVHPSGLSLRAGHTEHRYSSSQS